MRTRKLRIASDYFAPWYHPVGELYPEADYELEVDEDFYIHFMQFQKDAALLQATIESMIEVCESKIDMNGDITKSMGLEWPKKNG